MCLHRVEDVPRPNHCVGDLHVLMEQIYIFPLASADLVVVLLPLGEVLEDGLLHRLHVNPVSADGDCREGDLVGGHAGVGKGGDCRLPLPLQVSVRGHVDGEKKASKKEESPDDAVH